MKKIVNRPFPTDGNVRACEVAAFLGIGLSTVWLFTKQGRLPKPRKYSARVTVWDAAEIRSIQKAGIPEMPVEEGSA